MNIIKLLISPIQSRMLQEQRCPACFEPFAKTKSKRHLTADTEMVYCNCGRAFIHTKSRRKYRRALPTELSIG